MDLGYFLIIKPVGTLCNLRCSYCYYKHLDQGAKTLMSYETLEKIIERALLSNAKTVHFCWHGGEPTLRGLDFYRKAMEFQQSKNVQQKTIINLIQTNGVLINKNWIDFFRKEKFDVGISLDGTKELHDSNRKLSNGKGSFDRTFNALQLLQKVNIPHGVIHTVTKNTLKLAAESAQFFINSGLKKWSYNEYFELDQNGKKTPNSLSGKEWTNFLISVFKTWLNSGKDEIKIREIQNLIFWSLGFKPNNCTHSGNCHKFLTINYNGDIYPCERLMDYGQFGNIKDIAISEIENLPSYQKLKTAVSDYPEKCRTCRFFQNCHNGCTSHRISGLNGKYYFCESRKYLFRYFAEMIKSAKESSKGGE